MASSFLGRPAARAWVGGVFSRFAQFDLAETKSLPHMIGLILGIAPYFCDVFVSIGALFLLLYFSNQAIR